MSTASRRQAAQRGAGLGWFATLGGASLLLAFGFGIGLVLGSALEEPDLVAKHLSGEGTELPLPAAAKPAAAPSAAAPAAPAAPTTSAAKGASPPPAPSDFDAGDAPGASGAPARTPAPPPAPTLAAKAAPAPPAAKPPPAPSAPKAPAPSLAARPSGFAIQVGAFTDRKAADELVASLKGERLRAYIVEGSQSDAAPYRVRVVPYPTREQASDQAAALQKRRRLPTWVIAEGNP